jgi:hypothetical protein
LLTAIDTGSAAASAAVAGYQLAQFDIERVALDHFPFVKAAFAQAFTLVLLLQAGAFETDNITHVYLLECNLCGNGGILFVAGYNTCT